MTDREKLVELIHNAKLLMYGKSGFSNALARNSFIAEYLIANGVTVQQWIPVTERLPKSNERVIICRGDKVEQGVFLGVNGWWKVYGTNTKKVSHWMPMPEPPKEEMS